MPTIIATSILGVGSAYIGVLSFAISIVLSKVFAPDAPEAPKDRGVNTRVSPDTGNKLPIIYGSVRVRGTTVMAELSSDNKKMAYIIALGEGKIGSVGVVRWEDKVISFNNNVNTGLRSVTNTVDLEGKSQSFLNGNLKMRAYPNGGSCSHMNSFSSKWASKSRPMTNIPYVYIELKYDREDSVTGLGNLSFDVKGKKVRTLTNNVASSSESYSNNPAECILDYMTNTVSGLGIKDADIDLESLQELKDFCGNTLNYTTISGATGTAKRYTCNGSLNTNTATNTNLSELMSACQATLSYTLGKFGVVINTVKSVTRNLDSNDIIGGISVSDSGFEGLVNDLTLRYRSDKNNHRDDQVVLQSPAGVKNYNEPLLERTINLNYTSNSVEAERTGTVMMNQFRQSLSAEFTTTIEHLDLSSGDIISVTNETTGWDAKEFRIMSISEENGDIMTLNMRVLEYSAEMYDDISLNERDVAPNTNLPNINSVDSPHSLNSREKLYVSATSGGVKSALFLQWSAPTNNLFVNEYEGWVHQPEEEWDNEESYEIGNRIAYSGNRYEAITTSTNAEPSLAGDSNWSLLTGLDDQDFFFAGKSSTESFLLQDTKPGEYAFRVYTLSSFGVRSPVYQVEGIVVNGLLAIPTDVSNFSITPQEDLAVLEWNQSTDLDVRIGGHVQVRHTSNLSLGSDLNLEWASASILTGGKSGVTTQIVVPLLVGSYLIKFLDSSGKESAIPATISNTITASGDFNFLHTISEQNAWSGIHDSTEVELGALRLDTSADYFLVDESGVDFLTTEAGEGMITDFALGELNPVEKQGIYYFDNTLVNADASATQKLTSNLVFTAENTDALFDTIGVIDDIVDWDGEIPSATANIQISTSTDNVTFTDYSSFTTGNYNFLTAKFRVKININDNSTQVTVTEASISVDVADVTQAANNLFWNTSGSSTSTNFLDVFYNENFYNNSVLNNYADPYLGMSFEGLLPGEYFLTTNTDTSLVKGVGDPPYPYEGFRLQLKTVAISGGLLSQPNSAFDSTIDRVIGFDYRAIGY